MHSEVVENIILGLGLAWCVLMSLAYLSRAKSSHTERPQDINRCMWYGG